MSLNIFQQDMRRRIMLILLQFAAQAHSNCPFLCESNSSSRLLFADASGSSRRPAKLGAKHSDHASFTLLNRVAVALA